LRKRIDNCQDSARQMSKRVEPLFANVERLTPQQREYGARVMGKAKELVQKSIDLQRELDTLIERSRSAGVPAIVAHKTLHAGVCCILNGNEVLINQHVAGPVRLECRRIDGRTQCVLISERSDTTTVLQHTPVKLESDDDGTTAKDDSDELLAFLSGAPES